MKHAMLIPILLALILVSGCTPVPPGQKETDLAEAEREFDPLAEDADRPIAIGSKEKGATGSAAAVADQEPAGAQEDLAPSLRPGVAQGYRVQIFITDELREASRIIAQARERFEQEVYLEYDAPYYKVRVGDCLTEREGEGLLEIARRLGYPEAWLVRTLVSLAAEAGSP